MSRILQDQPQLRATFQLSKSTLTEIHPLVQADVVTHRPGDVVAGSPLNVISYVGNGTGTTDIKQVFRIYYQSVLGNIKEVVCNGLGAWGAAK